MVAEKPILSYLNAIIKRTYQKEIIDYINSVGIEFYLKQFPVKTREEIEEYVKTEEAVKMLQPYWQEKHEKDDLQQEEQQPNEEKYNRIF